MLKLTDEEMRDISNRVPPHPYLDIPFQYVELGTKAQLKKVVEDMDRWIVGIDNEGLKLKATPDCALKWWQALLEETKWAEGLGLSGLENHILWSAVGSLRRGKGMTREEIRRTRIDERVII